MADTGPSNEGAGRKVEPTADVEKGGWTPDAGKDSTQRAHKASQNAYQGGGKAAGAAGGTQASN